MIKKMLVLATVFMLLLSGCSGSSGYSVTKPVGEVSNPVQLALSYENFNGKKLGDFYPVATGELIDFHVYVETRSGSLTIYLTPEDDRDKIIYIAEDIPSSEFSFTIDQPGEYVLYLVGENHKGGYSITNTRTHNP
jgi:hypothetical protein